MTGSIATSLTLSFASRPSERSVAVSDSSSAPRAAYARTCHCRCWASLRTRGRASFGRTRASATTACAAACHDTSPLARRDVLAASASTQRRNVVASTSSLAHGGGRRHRAEPECHALSVRAVRRAVQSSRPVGEVADRRRHAAPATSWVRCVWAGVACNERGSPMRPRARCANVLCGIACSWPSASATSVECGGLRRAGFVRSAPSRWPRASHSWQRLLRVGRESDENAGEFRHALRYRPE